MIALSLPYWFQGHPEDDGLGIKTGLSGISTLARRHPDQAGLRRAASPKFPKAGLRRRRPQIVIAG